MKAQIVSDLHLECFEKIPKFSEFIIPMSDILILAGDICHSYKEDMLYEFLKKTCSKFKIVVYVLGNHEYYFYRHNPNIYKTKKQVIKMMENFSKSIPNLFFLNRKAIILNDICIAGCTLWSYTNFIPAFKKRIHNMSVKKYNKWHEKDLQFVQDIILFTKKRNLKLVMVTHHCPTKQILSTKDTYQDLYASNLDYLIHSDYVHTWVCGHSHENIDTVINGTKIISNQRGNLKDSFSVFNFSKQKIISV